VAIVLSLVLLRSGRSLGDSLEELSIGGSNGALGEIYFTKMQSLDISQASPPAAKSHRRGDVGGSQARFDFFKRAT